MGSPEEQILNAIAIASDHYGSDPTIRSQAVDFLANVRAESAQSWRPALSIFVATSPEDPTARRFGNEARIFSLSALAEFLELKNSKGSLSDEDFAVLKEQFLTYMKSEYLYGRAEVGAAFIRNKFSQILTLFFLATYESQWPNFFADMFTLLKPPADTNIPPLNAHIAICFFKLVQEISAEVADQLLKNARAFSAERLARDGRVRDLVRERDAHEVNAAVVAIVVDAKAKLDQTRASGVESEAKLAEEVIDLGIRAFASYVPWIDINLTVTPETVHLLFSLLSESSLPIRLATSNSLAKIVAKGLKVSSDKLKLIQVISLGPVLDQLEIQTGSEHQAPDGMSFGTVSFRESLAHVANALGLELVALCNSTSLPPDEVQTSGELLSELMPTALRFLSDNYDDVSASVFPLIQEILGTYKKAKQASPQTHMTAEKRAFLETTLEILVKKLAWDPEEEPDSMDAEELMEFENIRKEVRKTIDTVHNLDGDLVTTFISERAYSSLETYENGKELSWADAELAIYLVFMYGELGTKDRGKGRLTFCMAPTSIPKEQRKTTDYSEFPLTPTGEMMQTLIRSRISTYPHPTVAMQFFEAATRYADFFKVRKEYVLPALQAFLDNRGVHHPLASVRKRVFYLFYRFVQSLRNEIDVQHVPAILQAIQDILTFEAEIPADLEMPEDVATLTDQDFLSSIVKESTMFDSQVYMFEAAGALVSTLWQSPEPQAAALQSVTTPLLSKLSTALQSSMPGPDARLAEDNFKTVILVHHCIQALGSIPKGFPEYPSPPPADYIPPPISEFRQMAEAILVSLDIMGRFRIVREAARFAFGRIIFAAGPSITEFIPRLMTTLLVHFEGTEFVDFLGFLAHMTHKLQGQLSGVIDEVLGPLITHVAGVMSQPITGTDDKVARLDTKKAFLNFLNTIMSSNLMSILVSPTNAPNLEAFLEIILQMVTDCSDSLNQKLAVGFMSRFISVFGYAAPPTNGNSVVSSNQVIVVPGIEQFIYQRILVVAFGIPFLPEFNIKDAQALAVLQEIASLLQTIVKVRGEEAITYLTGVFLPSQNVPPETAAGLANNMQALDKRGFQKYLSEFVKASRPS